MRLRAGLAAPSETRCRALVGGFGLPTMRDLDFGRQFVDYAEALDWPTDVVVEDLSYSPHLVLHRLQELDPACVVLVGCVHRGTGPPGSVRCYRYPTDATPPHPDNVHAGLTDGLAGVAELDQTLGVLRHWGALPADTLVVEVEPADTSFGLGFSEEVGAAIESIVDIVRGEVGSPVTILPAEKLPEGGQARTTARVADLARDARLDEQVTGALAGMRRSMLPEPPAVAGLAMAARSRTFGTGRHTKGDWYDVVALGDGWVGVAMGDVAERGLEAAVAMAHVRSAARAAASASGAAPGAVVAAVERVVDGTGLGRGSTLLFLAVHPDSGEVRLANAGHSRPLLVTERGSTRFVPDGWSPALGAVPAGCPRPEAKLSLSPASTLLLYTDGLLAGRRGPEDDAAERRLVRAATNGPRELGPLCEHVMACCLGGVRRDDDASLFALRLAETTAQP